MKSSSDPEKWAVGSINGYITLYLTSRLDHMKVQTKLMHPSAICKVQPKPVPLFTDCIRKQSFQK